MKKEWKVNQRVGRQKREAVSPRLVLVTNEDEFLQTGASSTACMGCMSNKAGLLPEEESQEPGVYRAWVKPSQPVSSILLSAAFFSPAALEELSVSGGKCSEKVEKERNWAVSPPKQVSSKTEPGRDGRSRLLALLMTKVTHAAG